MAVAVGERRVEVLAAVFPLAAGGAACLQLQDEGGLRRGGAYLLRAEHEPALAPRFDELFASLSAILREDPDLREPIRALARRARDLARAARPRLEPEVAQGIRELQAAAAALDAERGPLPGPFTLEALLLTSLLIFVSEEERYPPPRYRGADEPLARFEQVLGE